MAKKQVLPCSSFLVPCMCKNFYFPNYLAQLCQYCLSHLLSLSNCASLLCQFIVPVYDSCPCSIVSILPKNQFIGWQKLVYTALIHSSGSRNEAQQWRFSFLLSNRGPSKARTSSSSASTVHWDSVKRNLVQIFFLLWDFCFFFMSCCSYACLMKLSRLV